MTFIAVKCSLMWVGSRFFLHPDKTFIKSNSESVKWKVVLGPKYFIEKSPQRRIDLAWIKSLVQLWYLTCFSLTPIHSI